MWTVLGEPSGLRITRIAVVGGDERFAAQRKQLG